MEKQKYQVVVKLLKELATPGALEHTKNQMTIALVKQLVKEGKIEFEIVDFEGEIQGADTMGHTMLMLEMERREELRRENRIEIIARLSI